MAIIADPEQILPGEKKRPSPSQVISWLLYPVVFLVGAVIGIGIGVKEAPRLTNNKNTNRTYSNVSIVSNIPGNTNRTTNGNTNTGAANVNLPLLNTSIFRSGDALKVDAATQAQLEQIRQTNRSKLVDQTADLADIIRQQDLIDLQLSLNLYHAVRSVYPSTNGQAIRLNRGDQDVFYAAMKDFYGGTYYEKIDPTDPTNYYSYTSDGTSYTLSAYLVSKKKPFVISSSDSQ